MLIDANRRHAAKLFLDGFDQTVRRKGRVIVRRSEWGPIHLTLDGTRSELRNEGEFPAVELDCQGTAWSAFCACGQRRCEHVYAALQFLLRTEPADNGPAAAGGEPEKPDPKAPLDKALEQALGRPLNKKELQTVLSIQGFYRSFRDGKRFTKYDLNDILKFDAHKAPYDLPIHFNHHLSEQEFWHRLIVFTRKFNGVVPPVMLPITRLKEIEAEEAKTKWQEEITTWKKTLSLVSGLGESIRTSTQLDLRLSFGDTGARLLIQTEPGGAFHPIKPKEWEKVLHQINDGLAVFPPETVPIFSLFSNINSYYYDTIISYGDRGSRRTLANLFRVPALAERLVNAAQVPFRRAEHPLAWSMVPGENNFYRLQLLADGEPAPEKFLAILTGSPTLYLTHDTVYFGPRPFGDLGPGPHSIPAPALETREGLNMLLTLGIPLPEAMEKRTVHVKMRVAFHASLVVPGYPDGEFFLLCARATNEEVDLIQEYQHSSWVDTRSAKNKKSDRFYLFDRSQLEAVPLLLDGLKLNWDYEHERWRTRVGKNFADRFFTWRETLPSHVELVLEGELASLLQDPLKARVHLECQEVGVDWFDLKTTIHVEDTELTPDEIQLLLNARGKVVRLEGKGWHRLQYELTEQEDESLARLGLSPQDFSAEPQRLHALQLADRAAESMLAAEQYRKIQERAAEIKTRVTPELPASVTATLRPYQLEGYHFLAYLSENRFGGILADDMGLGKTVQTLTWLAWVNSQASEHRPSLVVCPKSVMENWVNESKKFVPGLRVCLWRADYSQNTEKKSLPEAAAQNDLIVLNYSQLRNLSEDIARVDFRAAILDEAQYIKNPNSQASQAARALRADYRIALSGTPIENRLLDLWSLMQFAMPGVLGNRANFTRNFDSSNDRLARRRLASRVRPFLLRRTKNQVASDLPDRTEEDLICELEGNQKTLYRAEFKRAQQMLLKVQTQQELNEFRFHFLTSLLRLRQICCHPALVDDQFKSDESAKLNALLDLLEPLMEEGHKVLVFSQFVEMLQIIRAAVQQRAWAFYYLDGSSENRGSLVDQFQAHNGSAVFLISLKAGGFGLNLTAASYVVVYDPWWNPAVENQAIDRTHRIGQTQKVIAYRLLTKDSIEEKIRQLQKQKAALSQDILGDEAFASSLSIDDFRYLFADLPE